MLTGGFDSARLWDADSGSLLHSLDDRVWSAAFSPDGTRVLTVGGNGAKLWDAENGTLLHPLVGGRVSSAAFSFDGTRVLTGSGDGKARLWDAESGAPLNGFEGDMLTVRSVAFSPDGARVLTVGLIDGAQLWDSQSGALLRRLGSASSAAFSPDGKRVLLDSETGELRDARSGALLHSFGVHVDKVSPIEGAGSGALLPGLEFSDFDSDDAEEEHEDDVRCVTFSPDGTRVLTVSADGTAQQWDSQSGDLLCKLKGLDEISFADFSPDGTRVLTRSAEGTARLWDSQSGDLLQSFEGLRWPAAFSPDGARVLAGSEDGTARLWDTQSGAPLRILEGHAAPVFSVDFSADGTRLLTQDERTAHVWNLESGVPLISFSSQGTSVLYLGGNTGLWDAKSEGSNRLLSVSFSSQGTRVITDEDDGTARLWDAESGALLQSLNGHGVWSAAFSTDGTRVLTGSEDHTARLWDARSGELLHSLEGHADKVRCVTFSPDGTRVLTGSFDQTARLWDAESGALFHSLEGHADKVRCVTFSSDGTRVLTGSEDQTARLWNAESGSLLHRLEGHAGEVWSAVFSPDGARVLTGSEDQTARLWDAQSGALLCSFGGHAAAVLSAGFSPDGSRVLTRSQDYTTRLWDAESGALLHTLEGHAGEVLSASFSPDGTRVLTGNADYVAQLWDTQSGALLRSLDEHADEVWYAGFSPDGTRVLTGSADHTVGLWDARNGALLHRLGINPDDFWSAAFFTDGTRVLAGSDDGTARLWDAESGALPLYLKGHLIDVSSAAFSPDGKRVLAGSDDGTAQLWDAKSGALLRRLEGRERVGSVAFSPDGTHLLTGSDDGAARLWDAESGSLLHHLEGHQDWVESVAFSANGTRALTGSDGIARLWDAESGSLLHRFEQSDGAVVFSPCGARVLTASDDGTARLWDAESGSLLHSLAGHADKVYSAAFSPDGKRVLTGSADQTARIWDAENGARLHILLGHSSAVESVAFSPDGMRALTGSWDQTARLWDVETGQELCRLLSFDDGTWAVVDPDGRYDGSNGGDVEGLHWVLGFEPIGLYQFKDAYYDPGLLAKKLGSSSEKLKDVVPLSSREITLHPEIDVDMSEDGKSALVTLTARGGGIGRAEVYLNGARLEVHPSPDNQEKSSWTVDLSSADHRRRLIPRGALEEGQTNGLTVVAYNREEYLASRGLEIDVPAPEEPVEPARLFAVVAGASDYAGEGIDLKYAAKDAQDFARALELAAGRMLGEERVQVELLVSPSAGSDGAGRVPSKANLRAAFEDVQRSAHSTDVLVVFLSGHGIDRAGSEQDYHYLTCEAADSKLELPQERERLSISGRELAGWLAAIPANKQAVILDTCAAGKASDSMTRRNVSSDMRRAWERLKDRAGVFVLAGCAADAVSYELSDLGQGLLTYALLEGLARGDGVLRADPASPEARGFVDVERLLGYAEDRVPQLVSELGIGGVQKPELKAKRDARSFDVGVLTSVDRQAIPLALPRPILLRPVFDEQERPADSLDLTRLVEAELRSLDAHGREAPVVFWPDVAEHPRAHQLRGRYRLDGDRVELDVFLASFEVEGKDLKRRLGEPFRLEGRTSALPELARQIVDEARRRLETLRER